VGGTTGFEGNIFVKYNANDSVHFSYSFCSSIFCYDFGDILENIAQKMFRGIFLYGHDTVQLTQRANFTKDQALAGIFYHNEETISFGKLFWKDGGVFKEALDVWYRKNDLQRVIEIIGTIQEK
jgi:hypothetical protein